VRTFAESPLRPWLLFSLRAFGLGLGLGLTRTAVATEPADLPALRAQADNNDPAAQNTLGNIYAAGRGVKPDAAEGVKWYRRAADRGFAQAQFNLGLAYELGRGVPPDDKEAYRYYLLAAEQGYGPAEFNVGNMYAQGRAVAQDYFEANVWYRQAADHGVVEAQFNLGVVYETGRGVKKDEAQAAQWYKMAADHGHALSQYNLGALYEDGRGIPQNDATAVALYQAAARQGYGPAQNNLGLMYASGRGGLPTDPVLAYAWLVLAVENGVPPNGRDSVEKTLAPAQVQAATERVSQLRAGLPPVAGATAVEAKAGRTAPDRAEAARPAPPEEISSAQQLAVVLGSQLEEARQALKRDNEDVVRLTEANASLGKALEAAKQQAAAAADETNVARKAAADGETLRAENQKLEATARDVETLRAQVIQLGLENKQLKTDAADTTVLDRARARMADLQKQLDEAHAAAAERAQQEGNNGDALKKLTADLAAANEANTALRSQLAEKTVTNDRLLQDLTATRASGAGALADAKAEGQSKNEELRAENQKLTAERDGLKQQLAQSGQQGHSQDAVVAELTAGRQKLEKERDELKQQMADLEAQLTAAKKSVSEQTGRLAEETATLQQKLQTSEAEIGRLKKEEATLGEQAAVNDLARRGAQEGYDKAKADLAELQTKFDEEHRNSETSSAAAREKDASLAKLQEENAALKARVTQTQGTIEGVASARPAAQAGVPAPPAASPPSPPPVRFHTVAAGDSLSRISQRYYGTPDRWSEIYNANREALGATGVLRVGLQLRIP